MRPRSSPRSTTSIGCSASCRCGAPKTPRRRSRWKRSTRRCSPARRRAGGATSAKPIAFARICSHGASFSKTVLRAHAGSGSRSDMDRPSIKTELPGPRAKALIERDGRVVSPSYTRGYPFVMARGAGAIVEDVDGNCFLDCAAGIAVNSTGHSHPEVVAAIIDQAQKFLHMSGTDFYYE